MQFPPILLVLAALLAAVFPASAGTPIRIVAAENFYGDVAQQIGGTQVQVSSILANPDQDPHLFEVSPSVARAIAGADIVVYNGIGYDPWMESLLKLSGARARTTIAVASLTGRKPGDNPHVWYDPGTMLAYASALTEALAALDPQDAPVFRSRLDRFNQDIGAIQDRIATLRSRLAGTEATATEPVFGYMLRALGMTDRNAGFQLAVMNNAEPSPSDVVAFEQDLRSRRAKVLVYNSQASGPVAKRMRALAKASGVAVLGVTETAPPGTHYQAWIMGELDDLARALLH